MIAAGNEILATCIDMGGTISGEHGIGFEKREALSLVFDEDDLAAMGRVRTFNPPACSTRTRSSRPAHPAARFARTDRAA